MNNNQMLKKPHSAPKRRFGAESVTIPASPPLHGSRGIPAVPLTPWEGPGVGFRMLP